MQEIPKIIHYCWFGRGKMPEKEQQCIETWRKQLPYFELRLWSEDTFDIGNAPEYVRQAYLEKKWAFVSDYVRIKALYEYGGVYFDTDVEVLKPIEHFLDNLFFIGFENKTMLGTGIIGSVAGNWLLKKMLDYYQTHPFILNNGNMDKTTNVQILTKILLQQGFVQKNKYQYVKDLHIYERDFFNPKKMDDGTFRTTGRSVTIHHFSGSWLTETEKLRGKNLFWRTICRPILNFIRNKFILLVGEERTKNFESNFRKIVLK
jgi:mannosyltransferase OCH1-like enzyme